ncbi:hypothetical protein PUR71_02460 [Streptomyces sp. SP17BM10]|uniref:hypothetical protein n=1 Tax=Streptomyces sp. SP17BM10 TaxID=3002530 RepID=UPI002E79232C|nr:hypothetical protein [Streptomyces sp. SP17BM10]MEE1781799.1 hypothetical protein [Streptomyces sp. SP17BM10]
MAPPVGFPPPADGDAPEVGVPVGLGSEVGVGVGDGDPPEVGDPLGLPLGSGRGFDVAPLDAPPDGVPSGPCPPPDGRPVGSPTGSGAGFVPTVPPSDVPLPDSPFTVADTGCPVASSNATIGVIASTNTSPDTAAHVRHVHRRRARTTRGSFHSDEITGAARGRRSSTGTWRSPLTVWFGPRSTASRNCSPVRLNRCWNTAPPVVAPTLTTAAPMIVP